MKRGHWRHSTATRQTHRCRANDGWSPCDGGSDAGHEGNGYCANATDGGYTGPYCELCRAENHYFHKLDARCYDCGSTALRTILVSCMLLLMILAAAAGGRAVQALATSSATDSALQRWTRSVRSILSAAGLRYKVKAFVGFYQCIAAVPSVFNVEPPVGLEDYIQWINLLEVPSELERIFIPTACVGNYRTRLVIGSTWPLGLVLVSTTLLIGWEWLKARHPKEAPPVATARSIRTVVLTGLRRALPSALALTFLVLPSTSTRIFRTFLCDSIEYEEGEDPKRYLLASLDLSCDSDEYRSTHTIALVMLTLWPVGAPLLYAALLYASRSAFRTGVSTSLSRATAFLSGDYEAATFWWEPLEMCRKLVLVGWVLMIGEGAEHARAVVALFVSISFFGLNLRFKPLRRYAAALRSQQQQITFTAQLLVHDVYAMHHAELRTAR